MSRYRKEEIKKYNAAREGLTPEQVQELDAQEKEQALISQLARKMHALHFSEESDWYYDESVDSKIRKKGQNPMRPDYIKRVAEKRHQQWVSPLKENGMASSNEAMELCEQSAAIAVSQLRQRVDEILFYKWDPLGFSSSSLPRDEYANYVEQAFSLAVNEDSAKPLAEHLSMLTVDTFSLPANNKHDIKVAELIFSVVNDLDYLPKLTKIIVP